MTIERQDILADFYAGNYKVISLTVTNPNGSAKDLSGAEVVFAMFTDAGKVVVTKTSNVSGEIEITNAALGTVLIYLRPLDTLRINGTFRYQVNVVDASGFEATVTTGKINIFKSYARRPRKQSVTAYMEGI